MTVTYCRSWNTLTDAPIDPITEDAARARFVDGPWFTVVLDGDHGIPQATVELQPGADVAKVFRFTPAGSVDRVATHRRDGDRLFLAQLDTWRYADDARHDYGDALVIDTVLFQPDGTVRRVTKDKARQPAVQVEDRDGVDVTSHWRPVPGFGGWELLLREPG